MCSIFGITTKAIPGEELMDLFFSRTTSRGPDDSRMAETAIGYLGFERLSIMGLSEEGMQPFEEDGDLVVCNGEIYGFREMRKELEEVHTFVSGSDCELILPLWHKYGPDMFPKLGSEFALLLYDSREKCLVAGRDPIGIRPLYYGRTKDGSWALASEPKVLVGLCAAEIKAFPPGCWAKVPAGPAAADLTFHRYEDLTDPVSYSTDGVEEVCNNIHDLLVKSVTDRMDSDTPLGFLLSGGLDSSLVCAIARNYLGKPIRTFAIGMDFDPIDLKYAKETADFIGADHTSFTMTKDEIIETLPGLVKLLGTWDITTIRASMGMYLCCKHIHEETDVRVLMTGEISDELFGYKYTDFAPSPEEFQKEAKKRIDEINMYDVLRADRCISVNSLEARVPFGDTTFVKYVMGINPAIKMNSYGMGKYLLRHAFEKDGILPDSILWRQKAAFSDAVGHSMVDDLKAYAEERYSDEAFEEGRARYSYCPPFTKESLLYRDLFEQYYPGQAGMIKDFWMPNKTWEGCNVNDPSARVLSNYGASGQ